MSPNPPASSEVGPRALSFGDDPEGYDEARPSYPAQLVDDLVGPSGGLSVLDVGCGTGKASELFAARGCVVLGIDADPRMAAVARRHGLEVEVAPFETWEPAGRVVDLVVAAQSWHWVEPVSGVAKAAAVLSPGGSLAPFWNYRRRPDPDVGALFDDIYRRLAPQIAGGSVAQGILAESAVLNRHLEAIAASNLFDPPQIRRYPWRASYGPAQWRALLGTHSDHRLLESAQRERVLDEVARAVEGLGGRLEVAYEAVVAVSKRRGT